MPYAINDPVRIVTAFPADADPFPLSRDHAERIAAHYGGQAGVITALNTTDGKDYVGILVPTVVEIPGIPAGLVEPIPAP